MDDAQHGNADGPVVVATAMALGEAPRDNPTPHEHPHNTTADLNRPARKAPTVWWINGPFGGGKTTLTTRLIQQDPGLRLFDPEEVGFMLRRFITEPVDDFQSWPAWRAVTAETAVQLVEHYHQDLICPMSLLNEAWAREIFTSITLAGIAQRHIVLHADRDTLEQRILHDTVETGAIEWRLAAIDRYQTALEWLTGNADIIDTTHLTPTQVADHVHRLIHTQAPTPTP